jgi:hypothetical protein
MSKGIENIKKNMEREKILISKCGGILGTILSEFRKAKYKCNVLCEEMGMDFPNQVEYEALEREVNQKYEILSTQGLVELKKRLSKGM